MTPGGRRRGRLRKRGSRVCCAPRSGARGRRSIGPAYEEWRVTKSPAWKRGSLPATGDGRWGSWSRVSCWLLGRGSSGEAEKRGGEGGAPPPGFGEGGQTNSSSLMTLSGSARSRCRRSLNCSTALFFLVALCYYILAMINTHKFQCPWWCSPSFPPPHQLPV
jgi:hypothetical protein